MKSALINLCDQKSVKSIAEYVSEVGVLDVYAKILAELDLGVDSEEVHHQPIENDANAHQYEENEADVGDQ
jgi:hypothetical protein